MQENKTGNGILGPGQGNGITIDGQAMLEQLCMQRNEAFDRLAQAKAYILKLEKKITFIEGQLKKNSEKAEKH